MEVFMFNLLDEKWLLGVHENGSTEAVSVKDCMLRDFKDVKSLDFHGKHFYLYDYLAIRFLSTIAADILIYSANELPSDSVEKIIALEINGREISDSFKNATEKYFMDYHDRFDLFDETHPFMQFLSVEKSKDKSLKLNPLAPADSGRMLPESFHSKKRIPADEAMNLMNGKDICKRSKEQFVTTPQEAAYILLYSASIAPGVGAGNKSVLAGNAFIFETLKGNSLHETILLNMPISGFLFDDDDEPIDFGVPVWRWKRIEEHQGEILATGKIKIMEGMFFPVKSIRLEMESEKVFAYEGSISKDLKKNLGSLVDALRNLWANKYEPHALIAQIKNTDKEAPKNPYRKLPPGNNLWLLLAATAQTEQTTIQEKRKKEVVDIIQSAGSSHHVRELSKTNTLPEIVQIRYYYRMASDKWVYFRSGCVDGEVPRGILEDPIRQKYLCEMTQYITQVRCALDSCSKNYLANTSGDSSKANNKDVYDKIDIAMYEKSFMNSIQTVFVGEHSFLFEISKTADLDETYRKWKHFIRCNALEIFSTLMNQNRMETFWFYYEQLRKRCL